MFVAKAEFVEKGNRRTYFYYNRSAIGLALH